MKPVKSPKKHGARKVLLTVLIVFLIVLIWLAILALLIKFDVGGLGSGVLRPVLKDIPVVNRILPDVSEEQEVVDCRVVVEVEEVTIIGLTYQEDGVNTIDHHHIVAVGIQYFGRKPA